MDIVAVGINFANKLFALHDLEQSGKTLLIKPRVACSLLLEPVTQTPLRLSGTKACTGARHAAQGEAIYPLRTNRQSGCPEVRGIVSLGRQTNRVVGLITDPGIALTTAKLDVNRVGAAQELPDQVALRYLLTKSPNERCVDDSTPFFGNLSSVLNRDTPFPMAVGLKKK